MRPDPAPVVLAAPAGYARWCAPGHRLLVEAGLDVRENPYDRPLTRGELLEHAPDVAAVIVGVESWDADLIAACPRLRILAKQGVGLDNIDLDAAKRHGVDVVNVPGGNANAVAEFAVGLMIAAMRGLGTSAESVRAGKWSRITGPELSGTTVGLIGFGTIARLVARRLSGFDVRLVAWDPYPDSEAARELGVELVELDALLEGADILSLHVPLLPETRGFVNADLLARTKAGAFFVNTARGGLVDEPALVAALESGHLRGAALDVFAVEPLPADHPFRTLPTVVATGHVGADSIEAYERISVANARSVIAVLEHRPLNSEEAP